MTIHLSPVELNGGTRILIEQDICQGIGRLSDEQTHPFLKIAKLRSVLSQKLEFSGGKDAN